MVHTVQTTFNYYLDPSRGGKDHFFVGTAGDKRRQHVPVASSVEDIRGREDDFTLDKQGFRVVASETAEKTFDDEERIKDVYYKDCERLLKEQTGATRVVVMAHITRWVSWEESMEKEKDLADTDRSSGATQAMYVHIDQSYAGSLARLHTYLPDEAERLTQSRWAIINIWRPIARPATRKHLAICDARTCNEDRLKPVMIFFQNKPTANEAATVDKENQPPSEEKHADKSFTNAYVDRVHVESWGVLPPDEAKGEQHKWYYAKDMQPNEAMMFKIFDTKKNVARRVPHSAFSCDEDHGPGRLSLEARCLVFWEDQPAE